MCSYVLKSKRSRWKLHPTLRWGVWMTFGVVRLQWSWSWSLWWPWLLFHRYSLSPSGGSRFHKNQGMGPGAPFLHFVIPLPEDREYSMANAWPQWVHQRSLEWLQGHTEPWARTWISHKNECRVYGGVTACFWPTSLLYLTWEIVGRDLLKP